MNYLSRVSLLCAIALVSGTTAAQQVGDKEHHGWTKQFPPQEYKLSDQGVNRYFLLQPGYQLVLSGIEDEDTTMLTITVLNETRVVDGIKTRVVEEREEINGHLIEISRNFFAISSLNNGVFYFGEEVDIYENGVMKSHDGAWLAGQDKSQAGLMIPGLPLLGSRFYQEIAPGIAMDRAEIVDVDAELTTPAGDFENCLTVEETTPLEPKARDYKIYAPGIGLIKDGNLLLIRHGFVED